MHVETQSFGGGNSVAAAHPGSEFWRGAAQPSDEPDLFTTTLGASHRAVFAIFMSSALIAVLAPFPATKILLAAMLGITGIALFCAMDERWLGFYVLVLPILQLVPIETWGVTALNWQTIFLVLFAAAALWAPVQPKSVAISRWMAVFAVLLMSSAIVSWVAAGNPVVPLLAQVKEWLFPFILFVVGRRYFRNDQALLFLMGCVALVSFLQAVHALREVLQTSDLLRHRPIGMLTQQANLFGGYLAMYGLICLFASRCTQIGRGARVGLLATGLALVCILILTLSRGAWIAFGVTALVFGATTNRRVVILLLVALALGYRWIPQEAFERTETTLTAVEQSGDSSLEESLDDSAALRLIQWRTFPTLWASHPVWGTGLTTYPSRLGELTGLYRSAHATMIQIGTEMGGVGLLAYIGLLVSTVFITVRRAYHARPGSLPRMIGIGLAAAAVCLFLLDFTGARFRANTVTSYFWLLLGAFLGTTDAADPESGNTSRGDVLDSADVEHT